MNNNLIRCVFLTCVSFFISSCGSDSNGQDIFISANSFAVTANNCPGLKLNKLTLTVKISGLTDLCGPYSPEEIPYNGQPYYRITCKNVPTGGVRTMAVAYSYMGIPQYQGQGPHSCDKTLSGLFTDPIPEMTGLCLAVAIQTNVSLDSIDQQTYSVDAFQKVSTESFMVEVGKTNIELVCEQPAS